MPVILKKNCHAQFEDIDTEVRRRLQKGETHSFIYIAPTKRKVRELQREFLSLTPGLAAPAFYLHTLETLAAQLHQYICLPKRFVTGPIQAVLMNEAIQYSDQSLKYFRLRGSAKRLPRGTLKRIIDVINTLKDKGIYRSALTGELENSQLFEHAKLQDVLTIYDRYEKLLGDQFIDAAGLFKQINEEWDPSITPPMIKSRFGTVDTVFVSGFDEFSDPELTMLYNLSSVDGICMIVSFDYHLYNDNVFGHLKDNYEKFIKMGFQKITARPVPGKSFVNHVAQYLCNEPEALNLFPAAGSVTVLSAVDRIAEVELIAKIIKNLVRHNPDRDLSKICVSMYQPQLYTNLFREVFERYGIPANIIDRYYLDQSQLVVSIMSLLAIPQNDYRLTDIMRALSSPYIRIMNGIVRVNAGNIYEVAILLKIPRGYHRWMNRIEQRLEQIPREINEADDDGERERLQHEDEMLRNAKSDLQYVQTILKRFHDPISPREFKERLIGLMDEIHMDECMLEGFAARDSEEKLEKDTRAYQKFLHFLDEFLEIMNFEGRDNVHERLPFYLERMRNAISQVRYNIRQKYGYGVAVTSFDETRGLKFDVMIIAGLVDGEFPPVYQPEIFFSSARRAQKERYYLHEYRYLFYQALTNFTEHQYLTYPKTDAEAELVPSSFLSDLSKIVELDDRREHIPAELTDIVYSDDELLREIGKILRSNADEEKKIVHINSYDLDNELREIFDHMYNAVNVESSRITGLNQTEYNGVISKMISKRGKDHLERMRNKVYSITQLESYGRCPFQYFANRILRLNVIKTVDEEITPLERGSVLHEILFEFYTQRRNQNLPFLPKTNDDEFSQAVEMLTDVAIRKFDALNIPGVFWDLDKERILGSKNRKGILREFLEIERNSELEVAPAFFEAAFGSNIGSKKNIDPTLSHQSAISAGNVSIRGKIDRIDIGSDIFRVIDYKTGSSNGRREIDLGISLQLPIYLFAVERILEEHFGKKRTGAAGMYYNLTSPVEEKVGLGNDEYNNRAFRAKRKSNVIAATDEELQNIIRTAINFVNDYVDRISLGLFPVDPKMPDKTCKTCDYQSICRIRVKITGVSDLINEDKKNIE